MIYVQLTLIVEGCAQETFLLGQINFVMQFFKRFSKFYLSISITFNLNLLLINPLFNKNRKLYWHNLRNKCFASASYNVPVCIGCNCYGQRDGVLCENGQKWTSAAIKNRTYSPVRSLSYIVDWKPYGSSVDAYIM